MSVASSDRKYWGKYRGTVVINVDPQQRGRLMCLVPDVFGPGISTWCEACTPLSGPLGPPMGSYFVPPPQAGVWVEFENGDSDAPIWSGCRILAGGAPPLALAGNPADPNLCLQSLLQHAIVISDMPPSPATGGIVLKSATGATIVVNDSGIYISNGKGASITLIGPTIDLNNGALTVT